MNILNSATIVVADVNRPLHSFRACPAVDRPSQTERSWGNPQDRRVVAFAIFLCSQKSIPPMPPMPPPPGIWGASFFGCSVIVASVVTIRPAIDAAS